MQPYFGLNLARAYDWSFAVRLIRSQVMGAP